ncbi:MAG: hypothetical protein ABH810_01900 [bacterium]
MAKKVFVGVCPAGGKHDVIDIFSNSSGGGPVHLLGTCWKCSTMVNARVPGSPLVPIPEPVDDEPVHEPTA